MDIKKLNTNRLLFTSETIHSIAKGGGVGVGLTIVIEHHCD